MVNITELSNKEAIDKDGRKKIGEGEYLIKKPFVAVISLPKMEEKMEESEGGRLNGTLG